MNHDQTMQFYELVTASVEGKITAEQFRYLRQELQTNPEAIQYYCDYVSILTLLRFSGSVERNLESGASPMNMFDSEVWQAMAEYEQSAESMDMVLPRHKNIKTADAPIQIKQPRSGRRISRLNLAVVIGGLAALLMIMGYVILNPRTIMPVATLADSIDAVWQSHSFETGSRLANDRDSFTLVSGFVKLQFDYGAEVILEGPAEFQLVNPEQMRIHQGKITVIVPSKAVGFRVDTPAATVIDLGTEFSLETLQEGITSVHMYDGKASLLVGDPGNRQSYILTKGMAKRMNFLTGLIDDIPLAVSKFVSHIDSRSRQIWRSTPTIHGATFDRSFTQAFNSLSKGLAGYWSFEENFDEHFYDASSDGIHGTVVGRVDRVPGIQGQAVGLYNGLGYVVLGSPENLNFGDFVNFTVSVWVKSSGNDKQGAIISNKAWRSGKNIGWVIAANPAFGSWQWNWRGADGPRLDFQSSESLFDDRWHLITVTHDRQGAATFYFDGRKISQLDLTSSPGTIDADYPTCIGADGEQGAGQYPMKHYFTGVIDEAAIWSRLLNEEEVSVLYNSGKGLSLKTLTPKPAHERTNVPVTTQLSWNLNKVSREQHPAQYDLYFGTDPNHCIPDHPMAKKVLARQTVTAWDPPAGDGSGNLDYDATYYWRVVVYEHTAEDGNSTHSEAIWRFKTELSDTPVSN